MQPSIARKLIERFDAALSVQLFVDTEIMETGDELDVINVDELFEMYRAWPPRIKMSGAKFVEFLKVTCKLDVEDDDPVENLPAVIVGCQLMSKAKATLKAKARNRSKPPPDMATIERAARLPTLSAAARYLHISTSRLERLCTADRTIAALFSRQ